MRHLIIAALVAAGLGAATLPAEAGDRYYSRQCGWVQGRWCCWAVAVETYHRRVYEGTLLVPRGQLIVPRDGGEPIFIPRSGPPIFVPAD